MLLKAVGGSHSAECYLTIADEISRACQDVFWSEEKKFYLDYSGGDRVSQLTNAWAVLSEVADWQKAKIICKQILTYPGICRAAFFGKFYIFRALAIADEYTFSVFDSWRCLLKMGCTTWPEDSSLGRSECHAWSCAPNYEMLSSVLWLSASSPGCIA